MINIRNLSRLRLTEYSGTLNLNDLFWFRWISYNKFPLYIRCFENLSLLKQGWVDWLGVIQLMSLLFDSNFFQQVSYYDPAIHLRKKKSSNLYYSCCRWYSLQRQRLNKWKSVGITCNQAWNGTYYIHSQLMGTILLLFWSPGHWQLFKTTWWTWCTIQLVVRLALKALS